MTWWTAADNLRKGTPPKRYYSRVIKTAVNADGFPAAPSDPNATSLAQFIVEWENGNWKGLTDATEDILLMSDRNLDAAAPNINDTYIIPLQSLAGKISLIDEDGRIITIRLPNNTNIRTRMEISSGWTAPKGVDCFAGCFEARDAYLFGIPVLCSYKASEKFYKDTFKSQFVDIELLGNADAQVEQICKQYGLDYYKLHSGGFFIYHPDETAKDFSGQPFIREQDKKPFQIPAVYDVTLSPVRELRMPFMGFLNPGRKVEWTCSTTIGQMVSFYYQPELGRNFFEVISCDVEFSTTGDENLETLKLVDSKWDDPQEIPKKLVNQSTGDPKNFMECIIIPDDTIDTWNDIYSSEATNIPTPFVLPFFGADDIIVNNNKFPKTKAFYDIMKQFNPTLFEFVLLPAGETAPWTDWWDRLDRTANMSFGLPSRVFNEDTFPEITYVFSLQDFPANLQRIYFKYPLLPTKEAYDEAKLTNLNDKMVYVYTKGEWVWMSKIEFGKRYLWGE
jgi:hypothetical protein